MLNAEVRVSRVFKWASRRGSLTRSLPGLRKLDDAAHEDDP